MAAKGMVNMKLNNQELHHEMKHEQGDITDDYRHVLPQLAKILEVPVSTIEICDHPCGEDTIFGGKDGRCLGYMSDHMDKLNETN